jgi:hypothetical protein
MCVLSSVLRKRLKAKGKREKIIKDRYKAQGAKPRGKEEKIKELFLAADSF